MKRRPVEEQVVAIAGAASGIGRATALSFAQRGARVAAFDNDARGLQSLAEEIRRVGGELLTRQGDVVEYDALRAFADDTVRAYGRLDTWVHCAAVLIFANFTDTTVEEFRRVVDVDLMGQVYGAKAAIPHLQESGGGALIHVSSVEARRAIPYHSAYAAAKHGITGFVEAMRLELQHQGIPVSVTEIMPSTINTPLFEKSMSKLGVKGMGYPPAYEPGSVAEAILYAAEHPTREIVVGGAGKALVATQRLSPRLVDALFSLTAFSLQRTNQPRSADAPNNLFGPMDRDDGVKGNLNEQEPTFSHSAATWLDTHPLAKAAATVGAGLGIGALIAARTRTKDRAGTR
jgi:NAD(P)-dependent dehydrogenase (short-subunit alcohol dehydrogenase family)